MHAYHKTLVMILAEMLAWSTEEYSTTTDVLAPYPTVISRCHLNTTGFLIVIDHCSDIDSWSWSIHNQEANVRMSGTCSSLWNAKCTSLDKVMHHISRTVSGCECDWTLRPVVNQY